jgi:hypothetical protein
MPPPPGSPSSVSPELASVCFIREKERQTSAVFHSSECLCSYVRKDISPKNKNLSHSNHNLWSSAPCFKSLEKVVVHVKTNLYS